MESLSTNGFVRSGTTLFNNVLMASFPETQIVPYNHRIKEIGLDANSVVIIREPVKCVASWIVFDGKPLTQKSADDSLEWFCSFFSKLIEHKESICIIKFEDFIASPNASLLEISTRFNLSLNDDVDVDEIFAKVATSFPRNSPDWSDEPFDAVEELVRSSSLYDEAVSLFNQL